MSSLIRKLRLATLALFRRGSPYPTPLPNRRCRGLVTSRSYRLFSLDPRVSRTCRLDAIYSHSTASYSSVSDGGGEEARCWSCGAPGPFLVCGSCQSVQPVDHSVDYFQIFGLERQYELRDVNLEGKYKDWQKKLHPDLVHSKSENEREFAGEQSARVIDAYRTLSRPLSRALYLMKLENIHVDEEKMITNPDLLDEMMEMREAVDEASDSQSLKQMQSQIQTKLEEWINSFREAFTRKKFDDAVTAIQRIRYYDRAIEAIVKKL